MRSLPLIFLLFVFGCEAIFTDLTPPPNGEMFDASADSNAPDGGTNDAGAPVDAAPVDAAPADAAPGEDAGSGMDSGPPPTDAGPASPTLLGSGSFEGRGGYPAMGDVRLEELSPGEYQVVLSDTFSSAAVPGPVVVVTPRDAIGTRLGADDIVVTSLNAEQIAGAGTFPFSAASVPDDAYIFIYCEPFGVETARAQLVAP
ncbi:MAG: hypothetical protein AB8H86_28805 [Polyangiales bacterium]